MGGTLTLCRLDDVEVGAARGFVVEGFRRKVVVVRREDGVFGWLDSCPHYEGGTPMAWRTDRYLNGDGTFIACHSHGALFDIATGECVLGPCLGQRLTPVPVRVGPGGDIELVIQGEEKAA